jgi:hypothetical protein
MPNGEKYVGLFAFGKYSGLGTFFKVDGIEIENSWIEGK